MRTGRLGFVVALVALMASVGCRPSADGPAVAEGSGGASSASEASSLEAAAGAPGSGEGAADEGAADEVVGGTNEGSGDGAADAAAGAGAAADDAQALVAIDSLVGQHIAGLAPGTNAELVRQLLGEPAEIEADGVVFDATGTSMATWSYPERGLTVTIEGVPDQPDWAVAFVSATAPWDGTMPCGLGIGSSAADVETVLGAEGRIMDEEKWATLTATIEDGVVTELGFAQMGE